MGMNLVDLHDAELKRRTFFVWDDFVNYTSGGLWTSLAADTTATVTVSDGAKGVLAIYTDGTDNNEAAVKTTKEVFLIAANKPIIGEAKLQYTEANTDDANIAFGFADAIGANLLVDNGAGPKTSFSGALIYKVDGGTVWKCVSSLSTTQTISTSATTAGGSAYQTLRIEIRPVTSTIAEVSFFVDGVQLKDSTTNKPIKHSLTYTSATEMQVGAYAKAGGANAETLNVDYIYAAQLR